MEDLAEETRSLSEFRQNPAEVLDSLGRNHRPVILTEDGKPKVVVQEADSYQKLLDTIDELEAVEGIRRGLADMEAGGTQPLREAMRSILEERRR
jgi:prevent-host-death family protein